MDRPKIWVNVSRKGLRVPIDPQDGGGGFYDDTIAHEVERTIYIIRRLRDGDLIETSAPQSVAFEKRSEPQPLTESPPGRNKRANSRG